MADAGEIQIKVLMFPLDIHKQAKAKCVAVICDGKGFKDLDEGYTSENQCAEGVAKVEETIAFLRGKGIGSTPTYIFPDGLFRPGVMEAEQIRARLGLPQAGQGEGKAD
jgi:thiol:disulfide interchange protein DsbC